MTAIKKLLAMILALMLVLSFTACSDNEENQSSVSSDVQMCEECGEQTAKQDGLCDDCAGRETGEQKCEKCGENAAGKDELCSDCRYELPDDEKCEECKKYRVFEDGLCADCMAEEYGYEDSIKELMYTYFQSMADGSGADVFSCTSKSLLSDAELEEYFGKTSSEITDELDAEYAGLEDVTYSMGRIFHYDAQELDELNQSSPEGFSPEAAADVEFFKFKGNNTSGMGTRTVGLYDGQWYVVNF